MRDATARCRSGIGPGVSRHRTGTARAQERAQSGRRPQRFPVAIAACHWTRRSLSLRLGNKRSCRSWCDIARRSLQGRGRLDLAETSVREPPPSVVANPFGHCLSRVSTLLAPPEWRVTSRSWRQTPSISIRSACTNSCEFPLAFPAACFSEGNPFAISDLLPHAIRRLGKNLAVNKTALDRIPQRERFIS